MFLTCNVPFQAMIPGYCLTWKILKNYHMHSMKGDGAQLQINFRIQINTNHLAIFIHLSTKLSSMCSDFSGKYLIWRCSVTHFLLCDQINKYIFKMIFFCWIVQKLCCNISFFFFHLQVLEQQVSHHYLLHETLTQVVIIFADSIFYKNCIKSYCEIVCNQCYLNLAHLKCNVKWHF